MKKISICRRKSVAVTILVLTVVFLAPVTVSAEDFDYLFKFEVPVELNNLHQSVKKAAIRCSAYKVEVDTNIKGAGESWIPLQGGAYSGTIEVYIQNVANNSPYAIESVERYLCILNLYGENGKLIGIEKGEIGGKPKPGTIKVISVEGLLD